MALVNVRWTEQVTYLQQIEVDGFDPGNASEQLLEVIPEVADYKAVESVDEREVLDWKIVRAGDLTPEVIAPRKVYAEDF